VRCADQPGQFALAVVDRTEVGYSDSWQGPGGVTVDTATEADYEAASATWKCQVTSGALTPSPDTTTVDVPATFCSPARTIPTPGQTGYTLDATFLQDPNIVAGLNRFLFEHDTEEGYFLLGLDGDNPPRAIGRVRLQSGAIGGDARATLTADISLPLSMKPQILFGDINTSEAVPPNQTPLATGANAGAPGTWTPAGSTPPVNAAGATTAGITASPLTAWTTGQWVQGSDTTATGEMHWTSSAWAAGKAS